MNTKQVGYAYPTSDTAHRFGFGLVGCYFVRLLRSGRPYTGRSDRGFATLEQALEYAETLQDAYDPYSLLPNGATPAALVSSTPAKRAAPAGSR